MFALERHIDGVIHDLPSVKERYSSDIEAAKQVGLNDSAKMRRFVLESILHDLRHNSVQIFMRYSRSSPPSESDRQEMIEHIERRSAEIDSALNILNWN